MIKNKPGGFNQVNEVKKLKVLLYDIENTPNIGYVWGKWEQNVVEFLEESYLLCFSYKWKGDKTTKVVSQLDFKNKKNYREDYLIVKRLHELFEEADILVAHNGNSFDYKVANMYFLRHGLPPINERKLVDTKLMAKSKFRFNSNKLDDLGNYLGLGRKINTGGFELWTGCMKWDIPSWKLMIRYNRQDVDLLEKVYDKLLPWCKHPTVVTTLRGCRICGSNKLEYRGWSYLDSGKTKKRRFKCKECGRWGLGDCEKVTALEVEIKE
jgi:hypothetical protein